MILLMASAARQLGAGVAQRRPDGDSSVDFVVQHIRQGIISGEYRQDTKLLPRMIAERCGTSFIPVREAMRILESEGFVTFRHNRGAWVTALTRSDLEELYELRIELECQAVRSARPFDERNIALLRDKLDRIRLANRRNETARVVALNRDFHFLIYRRCDSPRRLKIIEQLWMHAERYQRLSVDVRHDAAEEEHQAIVDQLSVGDHNAAADAMRHHLTTTVNLLRSAFATTDTEP
jgi:DNA-binding GntR family transcriptional regulator